jgi:hypothetical protein
MSRPPKGMMWKTSKEDELKYLYVELNSQINAVRDALASESYARSNYMQTSMNLEKARKASEKASEK